MEKYGTAGQATGGNILRRMRMACWIPKAPNTHPEYVILIIFARQQWLCESVSMLRSYDHCLSCLNLVSNLMQGTKIIFFLFLISNFRHVLNVVRFRLGSTLTFLKPVILNLPAYEDGTECSETSAYTIQTPGITQKKAYNKFFFFTLTPDICVSSIWDLLHAMLLGHRIFFFEVAARLFEPLCTPDLMSDRVYMGPL